MCLVARARFWKPECAAAGSILPNRSKKNLRAKSRRKRASGFAKRGQLHKVAKRKPVVPLKRAKKAGDQRQKRCAQNAR
jgi:hypothetical protein